MRATTWPESGLRLTRLPQIRVNNAPGTSPPHGAPADERGDGVGAGVLAVGDRDHLAVSLGVGLGLPHVEQQAGGLELDVGQRERYEFGAAQRGGKAEQDHRGVADPMSVVRSMPVTIWRISATVSGRACRRGATPQVRRNPSRT